MTRRFVVVLALCLALPAGAQASTIVFTKDSNVWIADLATGQTHPITHDGTTEDPYRSPSQSDKGTIAAVRFFREDARLYRFDQAGNRLGKPLETAAPGSGPLEPQISPDGTKIGFDFAAVADGCGPFYTCPEAVRRIHYTDADRFTDPQKYGEPHFSDVSWIDNDHTLVFSNSVWIHDVGTENVRSWVKADNGTSDTPSYNRSIQDGELSRDGKRLVTVLSHYQDRSGYLQLYAVSSLDAPPAQTCRIVAADGTYNTAFSDPTWSPDGTQLAWAEPDGIHIATVEDAGCKVTETGQFDGQEPDWGPADYVPPPVPDDPPVLSKVKVEAKRIRYRLDELAAVIFTFQRKVGTRFRSIKGQVKTAGTAGANVLTWNGKVGGRKLGKGTYRLTGVAIDLDGSRSKRVRVIFRR